ncbi:NAC domain-containing protein 100 [Zea mays]|uniref:NAC domain-containing protein 100 n=1 Tax=Zea mays TaxID=4577 RepID=A0A3L6EX08_MAIZE|nr:hypothetical protein Zm00014a_017620 [Zea mays]PWZ23887.1 NAC domain-containing protein 100 [Zea mays]
MEHDVDYHHHHHQQQQEEEEEAMELPPGFRFHPTDEELITHYLARKAADPRFAPRAVGEADLNKCEPWDLPSRATMGDKEWYFFCVKDRKYPTGLKANRATESGYWKATGKDREIFRGKALVGMKKTLVFYTGRAPRGGKTGWVMHEYRLQGKHAAASSSSSLVPSSVRAGASSKQDEWVLCRVFKKSIEPPSVPGSKRSSSVACMGTEGTGVGVGPSSMSTEDDFAACAALPPLMDVSGGSGANMSLSAAAAAASIEVTPPAGAAPAPHVTCFSNAPLEGQFLNPPFLLPSAAAAADHIALAASASPFLASMMMQQQAQYAGDGLLQGAGGWYGKLAGERERLSGGVPAEISSTRHCMDHEASFWGF